MVGKASVLLFGVVTYVIFLFTTVYAIGFLGNFLVPTTIDSGPASPWLISVLLDLALIALFGVQHSVMARPAFKRWWLRFVPASIERSLFVLVASLCLLLLFRQWRPLTGYVWNFTVGGMNVTLRSLFWIGWADVVLCTFLINHFDLFGLRQVYLYFRGLDYTPVPFKQTTLYKYIRHPLMLAFLIAFWATPQMSFGHLLFAAGMTAFILIGILFEERDLLKLYGRTYQHYRKEVSMVVPIPRKK